MAEEDHNEVREAERFGGPAFPTPLVPGKPTYLGLTIRDWFAGMALAGTADLMDIRLRDHEIIAKGCYEFADALLKERSK